jgi:hypothetical protein
MKFSDSFLNRVSFPPKSNFMFHITPTERVQKIMENGLMRGSTRSTSGSQTQGKIYLTNSLSNIPDPFPNHFGWPHKDMSVIKVNTKGMKLESDPEDPSGEHFYMANMDIPAEKLEMMGRHRFFMKDGMFFGTKMPDEYITEHVVKAPGGGWNVTNSDKTKVLGHHDNKEDALKQLAAIEISKHKNESLHEDEELPKYKGAKKVGLYSLGRIVGYGYEMPDGTYDIDGLKFKSKDEAKLYGFYIDDLEPGYEEELGKHFHAREGREKSNFDVEKSWDSKLKSK